MTGTRQTGPSFSWGQRSGCLFRCLGNAPHGSGVARCPSHGSLSPAFAEFRSQFRTLRTTLGTHSIARDQTSHPPPSSANRGQCQRNSSLRMLPSFCLECVWNAQALNKDHVCRIGPSHSLFACFHLFVSIQVPCPAPAARGGRQNMREDKPLGVVWRGWCG